MSKKEEKKKIEKKHSIFAKKSSKIIIFACCFLLSFLLGVTGIFSACSLRFENNGYIKESENFYNNPELLFSAFTNQYDVYEDEYDNGLMPYALRDNGLFCQMDYETRKDQLQNPVFHLDYYMNGNEGDVAEGISAEEKLYMEAAVDETGQQVSITEDASTMGVLSNVSMSQLLSLYKESVEQSIAESGNDTSVYDAYSLSTSDAKKHTNFLVLTKKQYVELIEKYGIVYSDFVDKARLRDESHVQYGSFAIPDDSYFYSYSNEYTAVTKCVVYSPNDTEDGFDFHYYDDSEDNWVGFDIKDGSKLLFPEDEVGNVAGEEQDYKILASPFCGLASLGSAYVKTYLLGEAYSQMENEDDSELAFHYQIRRSDSNKIIGNIDTNNFEKEDYIFLTKYDIANKKWTFDAKYDCDGYEHYMRNIASELDILGENCTVTMGIPVEALSNAKIENLRNNYEFFGQWQKIFIYASIILAILLFIVLILATIFSGKRKETGEMEYGIDKAFMEFKIAALAVMVLCGFGLIAAFFDILNINFHPVMLGYVNASPIYEDVNFSLILLFAFLIAVCVLIGLGIWLMIVRTIKAKHVKENILLIRYGKKIIRKTGHVIKKAWNWIADNISSIYKARGYAGKMRIIYIGYLLINLALLFLTFVFVEGFNSGAFIIIFIILEVILHIYVASLLVKDAKSISIINEGAEKLAKGELEAKVPLEELVGSKKELALTVNTIGDGLYQAVEKSIKDERLKAELITNVSHDIKTPLTSIINYVDLLKREKIENPKAQEYLEILDQKSQRLKQLTLDLVEASKASTGNVSLELMPLNMRELMNQVVGEFADKFKERELELVEDISEDYMVITGDNKCTYRIFENLFQNIYKYSMPKSRVYLDLSQKDKNIEVCIRNISNAPLTRSVEELTERFTRGEQSRTTEGSGLGLSIAKDLTKLQGGEMNIILDGDLFKIILSFPQTDTMIG